MKGQSSGLRVRLVDALCLLGFLLWLAGRWLPVDLDLLAIVLLLGRIRTVTFARRPCCGHISGDWKAPRLLF